MTKFSDIVSVFLTALLGSGCIFGFFIHYLQKYIDGKIDARKEVEEKKKETKIKRNKIEDEMQHAEGRLFFWIVKAIETGEHNGDLRQAYQNFQSAEQKSKDLDREIIATNEIE